MPVLWGGIAPELCPSRALAARQRVSGSRRAAADGAVLSAARLRLPRLPAGAARGVRKPRAHLQRLSLFLLLFRILVAARPRLCRAGDEALRLGPGSLVVEVASNDGYLLQYFKERGIGVLGVEPAANVAEAALAKGIPTEIAFFGTATARRWPKPATGRT